MATATVKKVEHLIPKGIRASIKEARLLEQMRKDVEYLNKLLLKAKESKRATSLYTRYSMRLQDEKKRSERIEAFLDSLLQSITNLTRRQEKESDPDLTEELESLRVRIKHCKDIIDLILAPHGRLHSAMKNKGDPDYWAHIEDLINQALGTTESPGITYLLQLLDQLEQVEKRTAAA